MQLVNHQMPAFAPVPDRLLRIDEVERRVALKRASIYAYVRANQFPAPIPISPSGSRVAWTESAVNKWIQDRVQSAAAGESPRALSPNPRARGVQ